MPATIILYESSELDWLGPPASTRPVWDLRLGPFTPELLLRRVLPNAEIAFWARESMLGLAPRPSEKVFEADEVLLLDARLLPVNRRLGEALDDLGPGGILKAGETEFAQKLSGSDARDRLRELTGQEAIPPAPRQPLKTEFGSLLRFWWEMPKMTAGLLLARWEDALEITGARKTGEGELYLAPGSKLEPNAVVAEGPVLLDRGARAEAQSYLGGPCYLGPGTKLRPQTRLLHGVFAGPQCRLGGEIEDSVLLGYSNKQHDGFLGHAVIGEWVNLGAGTNNSDLKNNYSPVRASWHGREFETGLQFLGCCLGDHSKLAIGGRLNTGTVMGAFCNWFGAGFPPKELPDYSWGSEGGIERQQMEKALATARIVMARRGRELDSATEAVYRRLADPSS